MDIIVRTLIAIAVIILILIALYVLGETGSILVSISAPLVISIVLLCTLVFISWLMTGDLNIYPDTVIEYIEGVV